MRNKEVYHMRAQKAEREKRCSEATHGEVEERGKKRGKNKKRMKKSVDKRGRVWYNSKAHLRNGSAEAVQE